jgi:hypothetical protein
MVRLVIPALLLLVSACDSAVEPEQDSGSGRIELTEPEDGAETADALRFRWTSDARSGWFRLQVATDSLFSRLVRDINVGTVPERIEGDFDRNQTHFWRVRREYEDGSDPWSDTRSFTPVRTALLPGRPDLVGPADLTIGLPRQITVAWKPVPNAISYDLQIFLDEELLLFHADLRDLPDTRYDVRDLVYTYPYWWRVRARSFAGTGPWSSVWKFQVEDGE